MVIGGETFGNYLKRQLPFKEWPKLLQDAIAKLWGGMKEMFYGLYYLFCLILLIVLLPVLYIPVCLWGYKKGIGKRIEK
jgi:hypothetical protein